MNLIEVEAGKENLDMEKEMNEKGKEGLENIVIPIKEWVHMMILTTELQLQEVDQDPEIIKKIISNSTLI